MPNHSTTDVTTTWKGKNTKTYKTYIVLFICFATSLIHLELVTDYTTDAFIAAYKRFTSRRGICTTLTSGTNLKEADSELQLFSNSIKESKQLSILLAIIGRGGNLTLQPLLTLEESRRQELNQSSMRWVVDDMSLTYEEMSTLLTQIEAVLNSRLLCPLTDDPDDLGVLTPGHFLMGCAPAVTPKFSLEMVQSPRLNRWQLIRQKLDSF